MKYYESNSNKKIRFKDFGYEGLNVYRLAFQLAMEVFEVLKLFPKEEKYSLTDQMRIRSRSACANIGEGYRKSIYPKSFVSKNVDSDGECSETTIHLKFAFACGYISEDILSYFENKYEEVGKMLNAMIQNPGKFIPNNLLSSSKMS